MIVDNVLLYVRWDKERDLLLNAEIVRTDGLESEDGEDDDTGVNGRGRVANGQDERVFDAIVPRRIVAAESNQRAEPDVERIEYLGGRVQPDGRVQQFVHLHAQTINIL